MRAIYQLQYYFLLIIIYLFILRRDLIELFQYILKNIRVGIGTLVITFLSYRKKCSKLLKINIKIGCAASRDN